MSDQIEDQRIAAMKAIWQETVSGLQKKLKASKQRVAETRAALATRAAELERLQAAGDAMAEAAALILDMGLVDETGADDQLSALLAQWKEAQP
jgi:steroid 5-alpha reductase family enzyme